MISLKKCTQRDKDDISKEIEVLRRLSHKNIVQFISSNHSVNNSYIFTEYCNSGDLRSFLKHRGGTLEEKEAQYIIRELVEGLRYLNKSRVVHRDLKLANVFVHSDLNNGVRPDFRMPIEHYTFKIGDLGLAKLLDRNEQILQTYCGTLANMAPEVFQCRLYNFKADIWSLGTVLFELLTGFCPFQGRTKREFEENLKSGLYTIPKKIELSIECIDFLSNCLQYDATERWDYEMMLCHSFLHETDLKVMRQSKIIQELQVEKRQQGVELNAHKKFNIRHVYKKYFIPKYQRII